MNKYAIMFFGFLSVVILTFVITRQLNDGSSAAESSAKAQEDQQVVVKKYTDADKAKILTPTEGDNYLGKDLAPVVMIEYASLSCPHCAHFHEKVVEPLIPTYIESGKVKLIYRDYPLDNLAYKASRVAHCSGKDKYFSFIKVFFKSQNSWSMSGEDEIKKIAKLGGLDEAAYATCMANKQVEENILKVAGDANKVLGVSSTPTIFINGNQYKGPHKFDDVAEFIDKQLKGE